MSIEGAVETAPEAGARPQFRAALWAARDLGLAGRDPGDTLELARSLGLSPRLVAAAPEAAREERLARRIGENALFASWAAGDEFRAAAAARNPDALRELFDSLESEQQERKARRRKLGFLQGGLIALGEGCAHAWDNLEAAASGALRYFSKTSAIGEDGVAHEIESALLRGWADELDENRDARARARPPDIEGDSWFENIFYDLLRAGPQIVSSMLATAGAAMINPGAGIAVGASLGGAQATGALYDRLRREGVDPERAFKAGVGSGALQLPLDWLGLAAFMKIFRVAGAANIGRASLAAAGGEWLTEWGQAYPDSAMEIWGRLKDDEGARKWLAEFVKALPETTRQGFREGGIAAFYVLLGGGARAAHANLWNHYAASFLKGQLALHGRADALRASGMDAELLVSALEHGGLDFEAGVSPKVLLELEEAQPGTLAALGLDAHAVEAARLAGQDAPVALSRLHAVLDMEAFEKLAPHIRPALDGPTPSEGAADPAIALDALEAAQKWGADARFFEELDAETARIREEARRALEANPALREKLAAQNQTVEEAAADIAALHGRYALACARHGLDPLEFLRKVTFDSAYADKRQSDSSRRRGEEAGAEPESANSPSLEEALDGVFEYRRGEAAEAAKDGEKGREELFQEEDSREYVRSDLTVKPDDATARVVTLNSKEAPTKLEDVLKWVIQTLHDQGGDVIIEATDKLVEFPRSRIKDSIFKKSVATRKGSEEHREAFGALREMVKKAEYWKSRRADKRHETRGDQDFYTAALCLNGKLYSVLLKLDSHAEKTKKLAAVHKSKLGDNYYKDHKLIKIEIAPALHQGLPTRSGSLQPEMESSISTEAIQAVSLGVLRGSVKPSRIENNTLRQDRRGSVRLYSDTYLVRLFEGADLSTLLHESGHIFFEEMGSLVEKGLADKALRADYNTLRGWLGAKEGEALARGQREQAARGFEAWLREGRAPDAALGGAFGRFRKWLLAVYRKAKSLDAPLSDEVRGVFDRMLATERKISDAARKRGLGGLSRRELALLGLSQSEAAQAEALSRAARDKAALALEDAERKRGEAGGAASGDAKIDAAACLLAQDEAAAQMALAEERLAQELGHEPASLSDFALAAEDARKLLPQARSAARARHLAAMRRNHLLFRKALADGGREAALDYNRKALFNLFCARKTDAA